MNKTSEDGFTLIEVLVAFVIVSLGLVAFYQSVGNYSTTGATEALREESLAYAESHLAEIGVSRPLINAAETGTYPNGTTWTAVSTQSSVNAASDVLLAHAHLVVLEVKDRRGRMVTRLETIKLVPHPR
jgi:type II secretion system protein I